MFYSQIILARKGPLGKIWLAAHYDKKLNKAQIFTTDIEDSVRCVLEPSSPLALRVSGHLMLGIVKIYSRKVKYLMADCTEAMWKMKLAFKTGTVDLPESQMLAAGIDDLRFFGTVPLDQDLPDLENMSFPVITIDGPSASGKGTVARRVAAALGFHYLDSGDLYRVLALYAQQKQVAWDNEARLALLAVHLPLSFEQGRACVDGQDCDDFIRGEEIGAGASQIAALPAVRSALLQRQRDFRQAPGLVTDGRDMGSVVFPDATLKIFLTASAEERAQRRYKQLIEKGQSANLARLQQDIEARDARDASRSVAPLRQEHDARLLDTTELDIATAVAQVLAWYRALP